MLDVAVANSGDGTITVLLGVRDGSLLTTLPPLPAGPEPADLAVADLDLDGDQDLLVANHDTPGVTVLVNGGQADFREAPDSPIDTGALPHLHSLVTGDFNSDGWPDLAVESSDARQVRILHGSARGFDLPLAVPVGAMPYFRLGTMRSIGDRIGILVPGHSDNTVRLDRPVPTGYQVDLLMELDGQPWEAASADLDLDGQFDLIVVQTDAVGLWLGSGDGFRRAPGSPFLVRGATGVAIGDLDHDGLPDIAVGPWWTDRVTVIRGGDFEVESLSVCERPVGLAIADVSGDGRSEVLATCPTENRLVVVFWP